MKSITSYGLLFLAGFVTLGATMFLFLRVLHWQFFLSAFLAAAVSSGVISFTRHALKKKTAGAGQS